MTSYAMLLAYVGIHGGGAQAIFSPTRGSTW
jgi:hypothetical protein